jgi:hypothetical protein
MHELIASRFMDKFLLVRPGYRSGVNIGRRRYQELAVDVTRDQRPEWLSPAVARAWPDFSVPHGPLGGWLLVRPVSRYGYARASYELNLGCNYDCPMCATAAAGPGYMPSSAQTAATTGAATTPAACSARPATGGTNPGQAARRGWSSPTLRSGLARRSPCGRQPSPAPRRLSRHTAGASRPSPRAPRWPAGSRSGPVSPRTGSGTATRPGWPRTASPRSSPNSASATRYPACAASTPTPPTGCAATSRRLSRPAGTTPCARTAICPHSPVPLLDELLAPHRETARRIRPAALRVTQQDAPAPETGEDDLPNSSQPPRKPPCQVGWGLSEELLTWSNTRTSG